TVVFPLASSRSIVHSPGQGKFSDLMSGRSSEGWGGENAVAILPRTGTTGSARREPSFPPSCREVVILYGVGSTMGQSAFEIANRMRWPLGNVQAVRCI